MSIEKVCSHQAVYQFHLREEVSSGAFHRALICWSPVRPGAQLLSGFPSLPPGVWLHCFAVLDILCQCILCIPFWGVVLCNPSSGSSGKNARGEINVLTPCLSVIPPFHCSAGYKISIGNHVRSSRGLLHGLLTCVTVEGKSNPFYFMVFCDPHQSVETCNISVF